MTIEQRIKEGVRNVPDFPKQGIDFKDVTTIMMNPSLSNAILDELVNLYAEKNFTKIIGIESRGFLFGYALAMRLNTPFVLVRKKGKLPYKKIEQSYALEYGEATIEVHEDALSPEDKVLIHDDLLATGGSAEAAAKLVEKLGAEVVGFNFLIYLSFLNGQKKLMRYSENIINLAQF
jgi:adenine phosphoribosyltransferase